MSELQHDEYRIFGPPGTGKTTRVAHEIARAARRFGSSNVVAVSFTRAAAAEIGSRDVPLPPNCVGTLHSFCFRALGSPTIAEGKAKEWNETQDLSGWRIGSSQSMEDPLAAETENPYLSAWNLWRAQNAHLPEEDRQPRPEGDLGLFVDAWERWKRDQGYVDFTDLISVCFHNVDACPGFPRVGFFDEAQDFTPLELSLVRRWGEKMRFFVLVGDDDQCIYAFKGATPRAFLFPPVDDDHKIFLKQSWRVPKAVHAEALPWANALTEREEKEYLPRDSEGAVDRELISRYGDQADILAERLDDIAASGKTAMVLTSCSYMLGGSRAVDSTGRRTYGIINALKERGTPFHNPYRISRGDWSPLRGSARRLAAYLKADGKSQGGSQWTWADLWSWVEHVPVKDTMIRGAKSKVRDFATGDQANEVAGFEAAKQIFLPGVQWWNGKPETLFTLWANKKRSSLSYPLRVLRRHGRDALIETPRIVVGTIHSVKGGEADTVFVAPDLSARAAQEWNSPHTQRKDRVRRVFYVALTRARERLVMLRSASPEGVW